MIVGFGTDIVEISRIESSLERLGLSFAKRILTEDEILLFEANRRPAVFLSKRFCAKEAAAKALGTGIGRGVSWQHMQITHDDWGAPQLMFSGGAQDRMRALQGSRVHLSLSDEVHYTVASVIIES